MSDSAPRPPATDPEWDSLLRELRSQGPARPRPFFYGRVQARLTAEAGRPWLPGWVRRPAYAMLLGALVLALNGDGPTLAPGSMPAPASIPAPR